MGKSLVSIWMVTYNHEDYIIQAIESVLMQKTIFDFHLFIGEDSSTDNTSILCKQYADKYPDKITLFSHRQNIGAYQNGQIIYKRCFESESKYIAMLEGDDYWTDPLKLQKQVDFLEDNIDFNIHFHNVNFIKKNVNGNWIVCNEFNNFIESSREIQFEELVKKNIISTPSVMYRSSSLVIDESIFRYLSFGDYYLHLISAHKSKVYCDKEIMANYRIHDNGVWSGAATIDKINAHWEFRKLMDRHFKFEYTNYFFNAIYIQEHFENAIKFSSGKIKKFALILQFFKYRRSTNKSYGHFFLIFRNSILK